MANPITKIIFAEDIKEAIYNFNYDQQLLTHIEDINDFNYVDYGIWHGSPTGAVIVNTNSNYMYIVKEDSVLFNADWSWTCFEHLTPPPSIFSQQQSMGSFFQRLINNINFKK
jgi:hypothetical protein